MEKLNCTVIESVTGPITRLVAALIALSAAVFVAIVLTAAWVPEALAEEYRFPIQDRWVATVVGTPTQFAADLTPVERIPFRKRRLRIFADRELPDVIFYNRDMIYTVALQKQKSAPVMFLIAGTGAAHNGSKNMLLARAFYEMGYNIVSLSSPTYANFISSASSTGVPGHVFHDAEDLYRAMQMAWDAVKGKRTATGFAMTGYSLGGFNAAFVAQLDSQRKVFDFDKVLLINPPVNLYNSISLLDRMIENIPGGTENYDQFYERVIQAFSDVYKRNEDTVSFDEDFLARVFLAYKPRDEELAALVGLAFRLSSSSLILTSDVMTDFGFIKPKGYEIPRHENLTPYRQVAGRVGFTDFYHDFFYPFYAQEHPELSRDGFIALMSLTSITQYLRDANHIEVIHNADDVILAPGEIDYIDDVFGARARIYPYGGHLGNMAYRDVMTHIQSVFRE
ncbi:MAG: alpha/beta hydrolase [Pseudomonadota bacterium]